MREVQPHLPRIPRLAHLSDAQLDRLDAYAAMLRHFNQRINLVSRKDEQEIASRHVPHVLALAWRSFPEGSVVVDWGTGGGLPAIPLAIVCPEVLVHAVDSVEKKGLAVRTMAWRLHLENLYVFTGQAADWPGQATHSVSRATAPLMELWAWHRRVHRSIASRPDEWAGGLICLKGGELEGEVDALQEASRREGVEAPIAEAHPIAGWYDDPYFESKQIVHVYLPKS